MTGVVTWQAVAGLITIFGVFAGVFWKVSARINAKNETLHKRINETRDDLAKYKVHVAETYSTQDAVSDAVNGMKAAIDRLTDRLDRLLQKDGG